MKSINHLITVALTLNFQFVTLHCLAQAQQQKDDLSYLEKQVKETLAQQPAEFMKNQGQWQEEILYQAGVNGVAVRLMKNGLSFAIGREIEEEHESKRKGEKPAQGISKHEDKYQYLVWNLVFEGANKQVEVSSSMEENSNIHYLKGNDPAKWVTHTPVSKAVTYHNVYNNIDLHYYLSGQTLKYDYVLHPGANIKDIRMRYDGIEKLRLKKENSTVRQNGTMQQSGTLEVKHKWGTLKEEAPYTYQWVNGEKKEVTTRYVMLNNNTFGFAIEGNYDPSQELVIDPMTMVWCTYGGATSASTNNYAISIALDASRNIYITGHCDAGYPTTPGAFDVTPPAAFDNDAYITKLNAGGTGLLYSTFLGGSASDGGNDIAVNSAGEAFVTGFTSSTNFPMQGAIQPTKGTVEDAFVTKLNAGGTALLYSTYLGGNNTEIEGGIAINSTGEAFVTGSTYSTNFPTQSAFQPANGGSGDAFIAKLNAAGSLLVYSTYLGGSGSDNGQDIAINTAGEAFLTGYTASTNFPTQGAIQPANASGGAYDAFVTKFNAAGSALVYSTYLGGSLNWDRAYGIAISSAGEAFVTGYTESTNFPTLGPYQPTHAGGVNDAFVTKLNAAGTAIVYSTFLGGTGNDEAYNIALNSAGEAFVAGFTRSTDFPISGAYQPANNGFADLFVSILSSGGNLMSCGTYIGGADWDYYTPKIVVGGSAGDTIYFNGTAHSDDFPTTAGVYRTAKPNLGTANDQPVIVKMKTCIAPLPITLLAFTAGCQATPNTVRVAWSTASETNNDYFTIERSADAVAWEAVGTVKGAGNSSFTRNYEFVDNISHLTSQYSNLYYRLTQTDFDGKTETFNSNQVAVDVTECAVKVFPNPAGNTLNIPYSAEQDGEVTLEVYDVIGKLLKGKAVAAIKGNNMFTLDLSTVAQGMYVLRVKGGAKENNQKFVKVIQ